MIYTEESCELLGHVWADEPIFVSPSTCISSGKETYECVVCEAEEARVLAASGHNPTIYISTIAAEGDVAGYEIWQCEWCDDTVNVAGNHESGHFFTDDACACGATLAYTTVNVVTNDFSSTSGAISFGNHSTIGDGVLKVSKLNSQGVSFGMTNNPKFANIYRTGLAEDGTAVDKLILSFDIKWTGNNLDFTAGNGNTFGGGTFNWRAIPGANNAYTDEFTLGFSKNNGGIRMNLSGTNHITLTKDRAYRLAFEIDPNAKTIQVYVDGVVYGNLITPVVYDNFISFYISRAQLYCADETQFLLSVDNASIDYVYSTVVEAE